MEIFVVILLTFSTFFNVRIIRPIVRWSFWFLSILGYRIKIEKKVMNRSYQSMIIGSDLIQHTLKNEIEKMDYLNKKAAQLYKRDQFPEMVHVLNNVHLTIAHIEYIIDSIEEKTQEIILKEKPYSLKELIHSTAMHIHPLIEKKNMKLTLGQISEHLILNCDPYHLKETILNLLHNSLEASQSETDHIYIDVQITKNDLQILIKDTGSGISYEQLPHIIEPYFSTKKTTANLGLGLSYCYNVMLKHGGTLVIDSEINHGTLVTLHFPKYKLIYGELTFKHNEMHSTIHTVHHGIHSFNHSILEDLRKIKQMNSALLQIDTNNQHHEEAIFDDVSQLLERLKHKLSTLNDKK